jgi:isopropylmalate/homocitrate/citramalate synthase
MKEKCMSRDEFSPHEGRIKMNPDTHRLRSNPDHLVLDDVAKPNLYREIYPYTSIPKVPFNDRHVPMLTPHLNQVWITDTTFRDGQQARPPYTPEQILTIYTLLHELGGHKGIIRQSEFFLYSQKDKRAVELCMNTGFQYPEVTGWVRASKEDFKLVKEMGLQETGILTSVSDYHIFLKLNKTRSQALDLYLGIVKDCLDAGVIPRCHFEDITKADFYGFVVPYAQALMELAKESKRVIKIRACDTLGLGVPYPGAALPRSVPGIIYGLIEYAEVPSEWLEWHGHNDFYKAQVNGAFAWLYGCAAVNTTLLGFGERTGNSPLEGMLIEYCQLFGTTNGMKLEIITELRDYFEKELNVVIPPNMPLVGKDFNVTRAGIHADGLLKNEEIYNFFDTKKILNREISVAINDKSGLAGVLHWMKFHDMQQPGIKLSKNDPLILKIWERVQEEYNQGRQTIISDEEMKNIVSKVITSPQEERNGKKEDFSCG